MRIGKNTLLPFFLLAAAIAAAPGCRQMIKETFTTPRVEVVDVALDSDPVADRSGPWRFTVTLSVDNPNPYALNISGLAWSALIGQEVVAEGERTEEIRIPASGVTTVKTPVSLKPGALETAARQVLTKKSLSWEFNGSIRLKTPIVGVGTIRIPFSKSGNYDLFYILKRMGIGQN